MLNTYKRGDEVTFLLATGELVTLVVLTNRKGVVELANNLSSLPILSTLEKSLKVRDFRFLWTAK